MSSSVAYHNSRVLRFGNKGSLVARCCKTESTSGDEMPSLLSFRILRAYFRKRTHSGVVGNLLKDFQTNQLWEVKMYRVGVLTLHSSSFQTSLGKDLSNGRSCSWVSHSVSDTGSSKLLRQRANATAVALALDAASSEAMSLTISSTLRQACIGPKRRIQPRANRRGISDGNSR